MARNFYAGHDFKWMGQFMKAIPKGQRLTGGVAFALACCIHHQYVYKKQKTFELPHKILKSFKINSRYIRPYLQLFQQANLIKYNIKKGKTPLITLLLIPSINNSINNKDTIKTLKTPK